MRRACLLATLLLVCGAGQSCVGSIISDGKQLPNYAQLPLFSAPVTYVGDDFFYVQEASGVPGIRVELPIQGGLIGRTVMIQPYIYTNANSERYLGGC